MKGKEVLKKLIVYTILTKTQTDKYKNYTYTCIVTLVFNDKARVFGLISSMSKFLFTKPQYPNNGKRTQLTLKDDY